MSRTPPRRAPSDASSDARRSPPTHPPNQPPPPLTPAPPTTRPIPTPHRLSTTTSAAGATAAAYQTPRGSPTSTDDDSGPSPTSSPRVRPRATSGIFFLDEGDLPTAPAPPRRTRHHFETAPSFPSPLAHAQVISAGDEDVVPSLLEEGGGAGEPARRSIGIGRPTAGPPPSAFARQVGRVGVPGGGGTGEPPNALGLEGAGSLGEGDEVGLGLGVKMSKGPQISPQKPPHPPSLLNPASSTARSPPPHAGHAHSHGGHHARSASLSSPVSPFTHLPPWPGSSPESSISFSSGAAAGPTTSATNKNIRLQRVPTAVRLASDLFVPVSAPSGSSTSASSASALGAPLPPAPAPGTPVGGPTPSDTEEGEKEEEEEGDVGRPVKGEGKSTSLPVSPPPEAAHVRERSNTSSGFSAFSPLFSIDVPRQQPPPPRGPSSSPKLTPSRSQRERYRTSVHLPSESNSPGSPSATSDISPFFTSASLPRTTASPSRMPPPPPPVPSGSSSARARLSVPAPGDVDVGPTSSSPDTDHYAQVILQSRAVKINKWKTLSRASSSTRAIPSVAPAPAGAGGLGLGRTTSASSPVKRAHVRRGSADIRRWPPSDDAAWAAAPRIAGAIGGGLLDEPGAGRRLRTLSVVEGGDGAWGPKAAEERGAEAAESPDAAREVQWVDWLEEYRAMKEAKLRSDALATPSGSAPASLSPEAPPLPPPQPLPPPTESIEMLAADSAGGDPLMLPPPSAAPARRLRSRQSTSTLTSVREATAPDGAALSPSQPSAERVPLGRTATTGGMGVSRSRTRSMSISSALSSTGTGGPPSPGRERRLFGRQPSSSAASFASSSAGTGTTAQQQHHHQKKKKNIGSKIDAWWSAVKSNFVPSDRRTSGNVAQALVGAGTSAGAPASAVATPPVLPRLRTTTSAQSVALPPAPPPALGAPAEITAPPGRSLLTAQLQQRAPTTTSAPATTVTPHPPAPAPGPGPFGGDPQHVEKERTGLDLRRRQAPQLSLKLDRNISSLGSLAALGLTNTSAPQQQQQQTRPQRPLGGVRATSGPPEATPEANELRSSLRPNAPRSVPLPTKPDVLGPSWDQTPAPLMSFRAAKQQSRPPSAQGQQQGQQQAAAAPSGVPSGSVSSQSQQGQGSTTPAEFSMNTMRRHIKNRLASAKENCDRELQKIIKAITAFVEAELEKQAEEAAAAAGRAHEEAVETEPEEEEEPSELLALPSGDPIEPASEDEVEQDKDGKPTGSGLSLSPASSSPIRASGTHSPVMRRHVPPPSSSPVRRPSTKLRGHPSFGPRGDHNARRLSTNVGASASLRKTVGTGGSPTSSRSNSRSRSPLPHLPRAGSPSWSSPGVRARALAGEDDEDDPFIETLQRVIAIAQDVLDTPMTAFVAKPGSCRELVERVQAVGREWDDHPDWQGRGWYVQLLLAVAGLSRVVEWWQAEKGFWNFDQTEEEDAEPLQFVMRPMDDSPWERAERDAAFGGAAPPTSTASSPHITRGRALFTESHGDTGAAGSTTPASSHSPGPGTVRFPVEPSPTKSGDATARVHDLQQAVEHSRNANVLIDLSLDGERFLFIAPAWMDVVRTDPNELIDTPISDLLAPADADVFSEATRQLDSDDEHTVEVRFRLQVADDSSAEEDEEREPGPSFREFEGKGMIMQDRATGEHTHTMWVIKPALPTQMEIAVAEDEALRSAGLVGFHRRVVSDPVAPVTPARARSISTVPILCRICEREVPAWYFEKHNETCNEIHRLELDINFCNERLAELRDTIRDLGLAIDRSTPSTPAEYEGVPIFAPPPSATPPNALEALRPPLSPRPQLHAVRKLQHRVLDQVYEVLQVAIKISTPGVKEDPPDTPIERQRLLSPASESKVAQVHRWQKPSTEDAALGMLVRDVEEQLRVKLNTVTRMRNTIVYSEKVRAEWEEKVQTALAKLEAEAAANESSSATDSGDEEAEAADQDRRESPEKTASPPLPPNYSYAAEVASPTPTRGVSPVKSPSPVRLPSPSELGVKPASPPVFTSPFDAPLDAGAAPKRALSPTAVPSASRGPSPLSAPSSSHTPSPLGGTPAPTPPARLSPPPFLSSSSGSSPAESTPHVASVASTGITPRQHPTAPSASVPASTAGMGSVSALSLTPKTETPPDKPTPAMVPPTMERLETPPISPGLSPTHSRRASSKEHRDSHHRGSGSSAPLSPRLPSSVPASRPTPASIKDFEIIKPISKGAFGSVFLAKKKTTGDYYAIKVLRKSDMIAKNQITNVRAERMILMTQAESPFVAKLYFTFQTKDHLFLVMEYLNGGDCASLVKTIGGLPEEWAKRYIAEVVLCLENLHAQGVVHRDMKPDNLLIDQKGHLRLTDFGLSKIGLLGRQARDQREGRGLPTARPRASPRSSSRQNSVDASMGGTPLLSPDGTFSGVPSASTSFAQSYFQNVFGGQRRASGHSTDGDSEASENKGNPTAPSSGYSPAQSFASGLNTALRSPSVAAIGQAHGDTPRTFVGTPDYLAPESILGFGGDDMAVDWWAVGVILYEFLYGVPPFNAETPDKVFDNILSRRISWFEDDPDYEISHEARDIMERLMCTDPQRRLGANGAEEVKQHPFFADIDWSTIMNEEAAFVPNVPDPEATDYFDARGALGEVFSDDVDVPSLSQVPSPPHHAETAPPEVEPGAIHPPSGAPDKKAMDDFGAFNFKNLPVLKQANDEVIRKLRTEAMMPMGQALEGGSALPAHVRHRSLSGKGKLSRAGSISTDTKSRGTSSASNATNPPSPSTSATSSVETGSRGSPATPQHVHARSQHVRRPSDNATVDRLRAQLGSDNDPNRRNSLPTRLRAASLSDSERSESFRPHKKTPRPVGEVATPATSVASESPADRPVDVLVAEDNPVSLKILEMLLTRIGCRCVLVRDGAEAVSVAMGDVEFDCLFFDLAMPNLDGENAARAIRSLPNANQFKPIVAVTSFEKDAAISHEGSIWNAVLSKPVQKQDLLRVMTELGFKTAPNTGSKASASVVAASKKMEEAVA